MQTSELSNKVLLILEEESRPLRVARVFHEAGISEADYATKYQREVASEGYGIEAEHIRNFLRDLERGILK